MDEQTYGLPPQRDGPDHLGVVIAAAERRGRAGQGRGESRLAAATTPVESPYCSCKLNTCSHLLLQVAAFNAVVSAFRCRRSPPHVAHL